MIKGLDMAEPRNDTDEFGNVKIIITKSSVYDDYRLLDARSSDGTYLASIVWMSYILPTGSKVMQPGIINSSPNITYLSFDGEANFIENIDSISMPNDGSLFKMESNVVYYFKGGSSASSEPNMSYALSKNNKSIRMNNISFFNADFSSGVMMENFRASMEGTLEDPDKNGFVVILTKVNNIN